ncbi:MAG TPA: flagellar biosynthesis protein FlhB [Ignavibacteriaceae bacterium]|nr:flagellar biosynthesis protein FlhB [Ignavibacteriaceae bacterium]
MAEVDGQEKTEQASGKRLTEGREKGQVAKSIEINSFVIFSAGMLMIFFTQHYMSKQITDLATNTFNSFDIHNINQDTFTIIIRRTILTFLITLAPILGALFVVALVAGIGQVGFHFSVKALAPKFGKFNPITGIKKLLISPRSLIEVAKSLIKLALIGGLTYSIISEFVLKSETLVEMSIPQILTYMVDSAYTLIWKLSLAYFLIAAADFVYQKVKHKKEMMMTKQEVKEENKQTEGDPQIKARIRKVQFQAAKNRMMQKVPKADVVITNPTHYAIALKYDMSKNIAPKVLAKGVDELAQRIKQIALENNVPLHEDRELARALYRICDVGDEIPSTLFKAVAQVLAYVYQLKNKKKRKLIV